MDASTGSNLGQPSGAASPLGDGRNLEQVLSAQRLESLGRLAGGIAHDFNNVLGVILGYVELAKMGAVPAKSQRYLDNALGTIDRARMLADRLMEISGGGVRDADSSDLNLVVEDVGNLIRETVDRRVEIDTRLANDAPWLSLGPRHLAQIVMNLCVNACDAMAQNGGLLHVSTGRRDVDAEAADAPSGLASGAYALLRVRDSGPGVPAEVREKMFRPYFSTREGGSGMGLWAAREIVEAAGGSIELADSTRGAVFTVLLPAAGSTAPPETNAVLEDFIGAGEQILIIDDEPGVRGVSRVFLEDAGYRVLEAETGGAGLKLIEAAGSPVDLVLLDIQLPDISGVELAKQIRATGAPPQIVVITGEPRSRSVPDAPHLGKPFLRQGLLTAVHDALAQP